MLFRGKREIKEDGYVVLGIVAVLAIILTSLLIMWKSNISDVLVLEKEDNKFDENLFIDNQMTILHKQLLEDDYMVTKINNNEDLKETVINNDTRYGITGTYEYDFEDYSVSATPIYLGQLSGNDVYEYEYTISPNYTGILKITGWEPYISELKTTYSEGILLDNEFILVNSTFTITLPENEELVVREITEVEINGSISNLDNNNDLLIKERWLYN